jgi:gluconokinase
MDHILPSNIVIMGVSGAGKSTLGAALAAVLGYRFLDADDFHSDAAKAKIASGQVLDEEDRAAWLARVQPAFHAGDGPAVLACSALKAHHRETLEPHRLVFIEIDAKLAHERLTSRQGHFAGPDIAASQFALLETPDSAIVVRADWPTQRQVEVVLAAL